MGCDPTRLLRALGLDLRSVAADELEGGRGIAGDGEAHPAERVLGEREFVGPDRDEGDLRAVAALPGEGGAVDRDFALAIGAGIAGERERGLDRVDLRI